MNVAQIKDEIRKLNQIDKVEIFTWIDREAVASDLSRIGAYRSIQIRREIEERLKVIIPKRQVPSKKIIESVFDHSHVL
jgi:hypothetical protein